MLWTLFVRTCKQNAILVGDIENTTCHTYAGTAHVCIDICMYVFSNYYDDFCVPIGVTHFNQPKIAVFDNENSHISCCYIGE